VTNPAFLSKAPYDPIKDFGLWHPVASAIALVHLRAARTLASSLPSQGNPKSLIGSYGALLRNAGLVTKALTLSRMV